MTLRLHSPIFMENRSYWEKSLLEQEAEELDDIRDVQQVITDIADRHPISQLLLKHIRGIVDDVERN